MNMDEEIHTHTKLHSAHYCILQKNCLVLSKFSFTSNSLRNVTFFITFCNKPRPCNFDQIIMQLISQQFRQLKPNYVKKQSSSSSFLLT